jgi:hypothetical protein
MKRGGFAFAGGGSLAAGFNTSSSAVARPQKPLQKTARGPSIREYDARRGAGSELPQFIDSRPVPACLARLSPAQLEH